MDWGSRYSYARALVVAPDDSLVAAGGAIISGATEFALARFDADGTLDGTFGIGGKVLTAFPGSAIANGLVRLSDGRLIAGGMASGAGGSDFALARYLADGTLDSSFGTGGLVTTDFSGVDESIDALVLQAGRTPAAGRRAFVVVLRSHYEDGSLDGSFGSGGLLTIDFPEGRSDADTLVLDPDEDAVIVAGTAGAPPNQLFGLARYSNRPTCPAAPATGCRVQTAPGQGLLKFRKAKKPKSDQLLWKWRKGAATTPAEFGDPTTSDDYLVCIYDESGAPTFNLGGRAPAAAPCRGLPCWTSRPGHGFRYKDVDARHWGLSTVDLVAGATGAAKVTVKAKGLSLPAFPPLPLALPVRMQLLSGNGQCWEAVFSSAGVSKNLATQFKGTAD